MKIIEQANNLLWNSLDSAKCFIEKALKLREEYPSLSRALYEASLDEMDHVSRIHEEIVKLIQEYKQKTGEPPEAMLAVYNYLHEKYIDKASQIRILQNMYKNT